MYYYTTGVTFVSSINELEETRHRVDDTEIFIALDSGTVLCDNANQEQPEIASDQAQYYSIFRVRFTFCSAINGGLKPTPDYSGFDNAQTYYYTVVMDVCVLVAMVSSIVYLTTTGCIAHTHYI